MSKRKTISIILVGVLALEAIGGAVAYRSVSAAASTARVQNGRGPGGFEGGMRGGMVGYSNEDLAAALGITVDELNAAYKAANQAALDQAVKDALITQAQADQLNTEGAAFPFGGRWGGFLSQNGINFDALLANALGITVEELQAAYTQARNARIDQAVSDGKLTQEQADLMKGQSALYGNADFQSAMQTAFEAAVNKAVTAGVITQAQADLILAKGAGPDFGMGGPGPGGFGDFGRLGPGGPGGHGIESGVPAGAPNPYPTTAP
jgi:hypothetical protein